MIAELMYGLSFALIAIGLWGLLSRRNIFKIIIGFSLLDTGIHILLLTIGYRADGTAPIFDADFPVEAAVNRAVDPIPSALVLTAIVIGLAITALMLSYAVKIYGRNKSLNIDSIKELKW
jgi:multisubunit Na+/H+ antiporter MnhC subunit